MIAPTEPTSPLPDTQPWLVSARRRVAAACMEAYWSLEPHGRHGPGWLAWMEAFDKLDAGAMKNAADTLGLPGYQWEALSFS